MSLFDAHTHLGRTSDPPRAQGFYQLAVASTPEDCAFLEGLARQDPKIYFACGIHPWYSADLSVESLGPWLSCCHAIGEIGMDSVWCNVDVEVQRQVFRTQLALAEAWHKPIVLHTKGCEREVLEELEGFSQGMLVHWYSSPDYLMNYLKKGCYFTVGPDLSQNPAVQALVDTVPLEKLMLESDGAGGLSWALGREVHPEEIPSFLRKQVLLIAERKGLEPRQVSETLYSNAMRFVKHVP